MWFYLTRCSSLSDMRGFHDNDFTATASGSCTPSMYMLLFALASAIMSPCPSKVLNAADAAGTLND